MQHLENRPFETSVTFQHANPRVPQAMGFQPRRLYEDGYLRGTMAGWDITGDLRRVRIPTLITVGQFDHVTPACAREIHRAIPHSRLVIAKGKGHLLFFEDRDRYITLLRTFLSQAG